MSTTLLEELEQAAKDEDNLADRTNGSRHERLHRARSVRLCQRAAWVREEVAWQEAEAAKRNYAQCAVAVLARLTGPIPAAETAPTERKP